MNKRNACKCPACRARNERDFQRIVKRWGNFAPKHKDTDYIGGTSLTAKAEGK